MKNERQDKNLDSINQEKIKYFHTIEDFPKFRILEENYQGILDELLSQINKEKQINLKEKEKFEKIELDPEEIHDKEASFGRINYIQNHIQNKNYKDNTQNKTIIHNNSNDLNGLNGINIGKSNKSRVNNEESDKVLSLQDISSSDIKMFEPWVEKNLYQESNEEGWDVAPLMIGGEKIPERWGKFPFLASLVSQISGVVSVSFSLLKPGTHIVPHKGYDDYSEKMYRYHMGLIVPEGDIGIRVEKEISKWGIGKSFVFDDFMIHEAWNFTAKNRIVLIIDFLKDESKIPEGIKFFDANFNKSVQGYLKKETCKNKQHGNDFGIDNCDDHHIDNCREG